MDTKKIIEVMGGRPAVLKLTGLTKGRISQWEKSNAIPRAWHLLFHQMAPHKVPHPDMKPSKEEKEASHA